MRFRRARARHPASAEDRWPARWRWTASAPAAFWRGWPMSLAAGHHPLLGRARLRRCQRLGRGGALIPISARCCAAIHLQPEEDWTVEALAERDARLALRLRRTLRQRRRRDAGALRRRRSRMRQARQWLRARQAARSRSWRSRLGYESEASFSRAFKRVIGAGAEPFRGGGAGGS